MQQLIERIVDDYDRGRVSRRQLIATLTGAALLGATPRSATGQPEGSTFTGTDLNHLALRVTDIGRSVEFYQRHLGLTISSRSRSSCFLRCSEKNFVALFKHEQAGMDHYCYSVERYEAGDAVDRLQAAGLTPRRQADRVYFDDPDGLEVQVAAKSHGV